MHERLGSFALGGRGWELRFVRLLAAPAWTAWRAFVEPDLVAAWFPTSIEGELIAGAALRFAVGDEGEAIEGEVLEAAEPSLLSFRFGADQLVFELDEGHSPGTRLMMTARVADRRRGARDAAAWHESLARLGRLWSPRASEDDPDRFAAIHPLYVEAFGPAASVIAPPVEVPSDQEV